MTEAAAAAGPCIEVEQLGFAYGDEAILDGLELRVAAGEAVGLLGGNGTGKSTLLKLLCGLLRPASGRIRVAGIEVGEDRRGARRRLGYVPDEPPLYPMMSAEENLNLFGVLWGVPRGQLAGRAQELLVAVGLDRLQGLWVRAYSRGMRQRLALAAGLMHAPRVLLLDEPFTGVDEAASQACRKLLAGFLAQGGAILAATHQPDHPALPFTRLVRVQGGRLIAAGDGHPAGAQAGAGKGAQA